MESLNEEVWKSIPIHTNFHNLLPTDEGLAENQTEVKIFHNGEYLFVGAVYHDTTAKQQVSSLKRDVSIGISDAFVMVLDTQTSTTKWKLICGEYIRNASRCFSRTK